MIKLLKVSVAVVAASMMFACADETVRPDIDQLRVDLDKLEAQTTAVSNKVDLVARDAREASANAASANAAASDAADAANRAANSAAETNYKLDRMLDKAMMK